MKRREICWHLSLSVVSIDPALAKNLFSCRIPCRAFSMIKANFKRLSKSGYSFPTGLSEQLLNHYQIYSRGIHYLSDAKREVLICNTARVYLSSKVSARVFNAAYADVCEEAQADFYDHSKGRIHDTLHENYCRAFDYSCVRVHKGSLCYCFDHSKIWLLNGALAYGKDNCKLRLSGTAKVIMANHAAAILTGSSSAKASGKCQIDAYGKSRVKCTNGTKVILYGKSICIAGGKSELVLTQHSLACIFGNALAIARDDSYLEQRGFSKAHYHERARGILYSYSYANAHNYSSLVLCEDASASLLDSSDATMFDRSKVSTSGSNPVRVHTEAGMYWLQPDHMHRVSSLTPLLIKRNMDETVLVSWKFY